MFDFTQNLYHKSGQIPIAMSTKDKREENDSDEILKNYSRNISSQVDPTIVSTVELSFFSYPKGANFQFKENDIISDSSKFINCVW